MKNNFASFLTSTIFTLSALTASVSHAAVIESNYQGWVKSDGAGNGALQGNNTFTGLWYGSFFNSWANFDLTGVNQPITSAQLEIHIATWPFDPNVSYDLSIYDVETTLAGLSGNYAGVSGYTDLLSGSLYSSATVSEGTTLILTLSTQALADINARVGSDFRVGFTNSTLNGTTSDSVGAGIFINGQLDAPVAPRLILNGDASVPVPATAWLFGSGLLGLAGVIRKRS